MPTATVEACAEDNADGRRQRLLQQPSSFRKTARRSSHTVVVPIRQLRSTVHAKFLARVVKLNRPGSIRSQWIPLLTNIAAKNDVQVSYNSNGVTDLVLASARSVL